MLMNRSRLFTSQSHHCSALLPEDEEPAPASLCRRTNLPNALSQKEDLLLCVFFAASLMETGREKTSPTPPLKIPF